MVDVAPWFVEKSISEITKEDCEKVIEAVKENGCVRSEYAVILPEYAAMKRTSYAAMVEGYDLSAYRCGPRIYDLYAAVQRMVGYEKEADGSQLAAGYGDEQRG